MQIVSNNKPRALLSWWELTKTEQTIFDHLDQDNTETFFRYKGWVYTLSDFIWDGTHKGWDGCMEQSYFDAILVKIVDDETVIVGHAFA
jgi:hypothetical protein